MSTIEVVFAAAAIAWLPGFVVLLPARLPLLFTVAVAPAITLFITYVGAASASAVGVEWSVLWLIVITIIGGAIAVGVARLRPPPSPPADPWVGRAAGVAIAVAVVVSAAWGGHVYMQASDGLRVIQQDIDWTFHANAVRSIGDSGDGTPNGLRAVNAYETDERYYYPATFHALTALTYRLGGDVVQSLHANIVLWFLMLPIGAVALARAIRLRALGAIAAALAATAFSGLPYEPLWRGLAPYVETLVVAVPILAVVVFAAERRHWWGAAAIAAAVVGAVTTHTSAVATLAVFGVPLVVGLLWRAQDRRRLVVWLVGTGAAVVVALLPTLFALVTSLGGELAFDWPKLLTLREGVRTGALFGTGYRPTVQTVLALGFWTGVVAALVRRCHLAIALVAGTVVSIGLYVLAVSSESPIGERLTSPWWNDQLRLTALAAVVAPVVVGVGADVVGGLSAARLRRRLGPSTRYSEPMTITAAALGTVVLAAATYGVAIDQYAGRNRDILEEKYRDEGPAVTPDERRGMRELRRLHRPGTRVMNDHRDGSAWMYALEGVPPVFGHIQIDKSMPLQDLLDTRFDDIARDPEVRAVARRLRIDLVWISDEFLLPDMKRATGLDTIAGQPTLFRLVYENPDVAIYRIHWDRLPDP